LVSYWQILKGEGWQTPALALCSLFPDAKVAENGFQEIILHCLAGNFSQGAGCGAKVYGDEVIGHAGGGA
jgi:hypothetical protein